MSNARKIAVVIPKYGLVGGVERFAFDLAEHLSLKEWKASTNFLVIT